MNDHVLVTGGAGYVGSHACKALARDGFVPVTVDNLSRGHRSAVKWGPFEAGDLADGAFLDRVLARYKPVAVLHFAAFAYVGESVQLPEMYYRNNVCGSLSLFEAVRRHAVPALVFSSTCAVYGIPSTPLLAEDHPTQPINPYGRSKLMVETILRDLDAAHGLSSVCLRYFNAAGADPEGEIGEVHDPETHAMPLAIETALGRRTSFDILGTDYPTADGTPVRDYIHVMDLASAHVAALRYLLAGGATTVLNLGTGQGSSVRELIDAVARITGKPVPVRNKPRRAGDPPQLVADAARAARVLSWRPTQSSLDNIVATAASWHRRTTG
jgi:UDP-glucose-4-epimerase GalE